MSEDVQTQDDVSYVEVEASTGADKTPFPDAADEDGRVSGKFNFNVGGSLEEDIEIFGADVIREHWLRSATVKGQAAIRRELENGTHPDDVAEQLEDWRPDVKHTTKKDPKAAILSNYNKLSEEDKAELIAQLEENN